MAVESAETVQSQASQPIDAAAAPDVAADTSAPEPTFTSVAAEETESGQTAGPMETSAKSPPLPTNSPPPTATNAPTSTPTATPTETAIPTSTLTPTATEIPPTDTPTPTPTPTPLPEGWVFSGVRAYSDKGQGDLLLFGEMINNTGQAQILAFVLGDFYDAQGQKIRGVSTVDYWPIEVVPQGGQVPFELIVYGPDSLGDFELSVKAEPADDDETPGQDFEFFDVNPSAGPDEYCVSGRLQNPGGQLEYYLSIVAVLYDDQDNVINFDDLYQYSPDLDGNEIVDFEVCVDPLDQQVARHEVRAWGL